MSNAKLFDYCSEKNDFPTNNKKIEELLASKKNINVMYHNGACFKYSVKHSNLELLNILINHYKNQIKWEQGSDGYYQELQKLADVLERAEDYSDEDSEVGLEIIEIIRSITEEAYPPSDESSEDSRAHDFDDEDISSDYDFERNEIIDTTILDNSHYYDNGQISGNSEDDSLYTAWLECT